jgi:hypothetical protein
MEPTLLDYVNFIWGIQFFIFLAPKKKLMKVEILELFFVFLGGTNENNSSQKEKGKQQLSQQQVG